MSYSALFRIPSLCALATDPVVWGVGFTAWGIGVAAWGAGNKGGATSRRGAVTISFRLMIMFSSPLARYASRRSLLANLSFVVRLTQYRHHVCFLALLVLCSALASYTFDQCFRIPSLCVDFFLNCLEMIVFAKSSC